VRSSELETGRGIGNDWVIRHEGGNLQLKPGSRRYGPTRIKALVWEWEDGTMKVYCRGEAIAFAKLKKQPQKASAPLPPRPSSGGAVGGKRPSLAPTLPDYADPDSQRADRSAARWDAHFRFALNYRASLQSVFERERPQPKKGTFLIS